MSNVRTRYAPSPTGLQHLGGIRTALFNWLWAKHNNGKFILRFEDTDVKRSVPAAEKHILDTLNWLSIKPDESTSEGGEYGPYRQSERLKIYSKYADILIKKGILYRDWTSEDALSEMRKEASKNKTPFRVRADMLETSGSQSRPHVLRFKINTKGTTSWQDAVHGKQSWSNSELDDFIVVKSDGFPTYNFANVIDDHLMQITHVLRGDEFLASTPKHLQIYSALGWNPPHYAHLPSVLGTDKAKLSKRHGALDALKYKELGYLPEAIINFLALLGWHPGSTEEKLSIDDLKNKFSLERLHTSPAIFDPERLNWLNGIYIRKTDPKKLLKLVESYWPKQAETFDDSYKLQVLKLVQDRLKLLSELSALTNYFFTKPKLNKNLLKKGGANLPDVKKWVEETIVALTSVTFTKSAIEKALRKIQTTRKLSAGEFLGSLRWILTGVSASPGLFETMETLGKKEALARLQAASDLLQKKNLDNITSVQ